MFCQCSQHNFTYLLYFTLLTYFRLLTYLIYFTLLYFTYLLTPSNTFLLQKLTGSKLVKKFPTFYATRSFITALTSNRHLSLS